MALQKAVEQAKAQKGVTWVGNFGTPLDSNLFYSDLGRYGKIFFIFKIHADPSNINLNRCDVMSGDTASKSRKAPAESSPGASSSVVATPTPRAKPDGTDGDQVSLPKLSRTVQSQRLLEPVVKVQRSPTVHYSPEKEVGEQDTWDEDTDPNEPTDRKTKRTAVKAKSAPKAVAQVASAPDAAAGGERTKKKARTATDAKAEPPLAPETPKGATAEAVKAALARQTTVELTSARAAASTLSPSPPPSPGSPEEEDKASATVPEDKDQLTLKQVQARKAAHARYMRFSRSIKSKSS